MRLTIDKSLSNTRMLVTVSEVNPTTSGSTLELFNVSTNVTNTFSLPDDTSTYPDRYNEFLLPTSTFSGLTYGIYNFSIRDVSGNTTETGQVRVIADDLTPQQQLDSTYVYISPEETDDDYIVYQP